MAKSLADQLLNAGLVDKKKVKQAQHEKKKQAKQAQKGQAQQEDTQARLQREREEKAERDRQLNKEHQEAEAAKAKQAQLEQIITQGQVTVKGEVRFNFTDHRIKKIKQLYVNDSIQQQLASGKLAICALKDGYAVVPKDVAAKVAERDRASVVFQADPTDNQPDEDDPYKDFQIPDDLMW